MDSFQQPAFAFSEPREDFDPSHIPADGMEYLQRVLFERRSCPAVVVSQLRNGNKGVQFRDVLKIHEVRLNVFTFLIYITLRIEVRRQFNANMFYSHIE